METDPSAALLWSHVTKARSFPLSFFTGAHWAVPAVLCSDRQPRCRRGGPWLWEPSALFNAQEAPGRFKKHAADVMEPLMCLGFSSGISLYQKTKVLMGLSAERKAGAVWLGRGCVAPRCSASFPRQPPAANCPPQSWAHAGAQHSSVGPCLMLIPYRKRN